MIAMLGVNAETGCWGARIPQVEEDSTFEPAANWLERQLSFAVQFQAMRGGGMFVLSLPGV